MGQDLLSHEKNETIVFRNGNVITPEYTIIFENIYNTKTGELIPNADTLSYNRAQMLSQDAKEQLRISDMILETDLLSYYTLPGLE
ncbi:MAG TPA: LTA synthase family protein, partial [Clostridiales bacterium]|nr:LTA synthase family protein [Clostridiales bacterium]